jgi:hypothetical protein
MTDPRLQRTGFAARAATLAEQFEQAVAGLPVAGYRATMTAPDATTSGGVQALQHIRLEPGDPSAHTFVVGNANRIERVAELRTLAYVDRVCFERFGQPSGLDPAQYAAFLEGAAGFLETFGLTVSRANVPPPGSPTRSSRPPAPRPQVSVLALTPAVITALVIWSFALIGIGAVIGVLVAEGRFHR